MIHSSMLRFIRVLSLLALFVSSPTPAIPPEHQTILRFRNIQEGAGPFLAGSFLTSSDQNIQLGPEFTIEFSVFLDSRGASDFLKREIDGDPFMHYIVNISANGMPGFWQSTSAPGSLVQLTGPTALPLNRWIHIAGVLDSGMLKLYIDGVLVAESASSGAPANDASQDLQLGNQFKGALAQMRLWNRALPVGELMQIADSVIDPVTAVDLVAYWPLDDGESQFARDLGPLQSTLMLGNTDQIDLFDPRWGTVKLTVREWYIGHRADCKLLILGSPTGHLRHEMALVSLNLTVPI